jgi:hypothetical protein
LNGRPARPPRNTPSGGCRSSRNPGRPGPEIHPHSAARSLDSRPTCTCDTSSASATGKRHESVVLARTTRIPSKNGPSTRPGRRMYSRHENPAGRRTRTTDEDDGGDEGGRRQKIRRGAVRTVDSVLMNRTLSE